MTVEIQAANQLSVFKLLFFIFATFYAICYRYIDSSRGLIDLAYIIILSQITQMTQRYTAKLYLFRRERQVGVVHVVLGFVCVNQRDLRDTLGFHLCRLIEYS